MRKGERTRGRILDAASELFAVKGYSGTSVRQIADAADVNVAAISMYFDSKERLYGTILSEGLEELVARREAALLACPMEPELSEVLEAFVFPLFEMLDSGSRQANFLRILSRSLFEPDPAFVSTASGRAKALMEDFVKAIQQCTPGLKPRSIRQRLGFAIGAISQALADPNRPAGRGVRAELLRFLNAAFT